MRKCFRQFVLAAALVVLLCGRLANGGSLSTSHRSLRGTFGTDRYQELTNASEALVEVEKDMCDGRLRNDSLASGHDDDWYRQCHEHWKEADTVAPAGQWTQREFTNFVQLQSHAEFKQLPLPLAMIFNEVSCRCVLNESSDCCHGDNAKIAPTDKENNTVWMDSICNRVDIALGEVCRRQQKESRGNEL